MNASEKDQNSEALSKKSGQGSQNGREMDVNNDANEKGNINVVYKDSIKRQIEKIGEVKLNNTTKTISI